MRTPARPALALAAAFALAACRDETPVGCPVRGIDVSRHQGPIDWASVADAGIRFAWIKATEGGDYRDPLFRRNWLLADAAGVRRGAYLFVYWCRPAADQAAWFAANVPADPGALPPVLDVEWTPGSRNCAAKVPRDKAVAEMRIMLTALERTYGVKPIIYAPADFYRQILGDAFADYPLWARGLGARPDDDYAGRAWAVWQHSETGRVQGIDGAVDRDCARTLPATTAEASGGPRP